MWQSSPAIFVGSTISAEAVCDCSTATDGLKLAADQKPLLIEGKTVLPDVGMRETPIRIRRRQAESAPLRRLALGQAETPVEAGDCLAAILRKLIADLPELLALLVKEYDGCYQRLR